MNFLRNSNIEQGILELKLKQITNGVVIYLHNTKAVLQHPAIPVATKSLATMNIANDVEKAHIMAKHTAMKEQTAIVSLLPNLFKTENKQQVK